MKEGEREFQINGRIEGRPLVLVYECVEYGNWQAEGLNALSGWQYFLSNES